MRKIVPIVVCLFLIIFIVVYALFLRPSSIEVITIKRAYNINTSLDENDFIDIEIYVNQKHVYFTDQSQIRESYLTNEIESDIIPLKLEKITFGKEDKINSETYYLFIFTYKINLSITTYFSWEIPKAYLTISYVNDVNTFLSIGSFSYYKMSDYTNSFVPVSALKGLMTEIDGNNILAGILIGLRNYSSGTVVVKKIILNDCNLHLANGFQLTTWDNEKTVEQYLGYNYQYCTESKNENLNAVILSNQNNVYFIPIFYLENYLINKFSITLILEVNNQDIIFNYPSFQFFNYTNQVIATNLLIKYTFPYD